jgi:hypothetical protein
MILARESSLPSLREQRPQVNTASLAAARPAFADKPEQHMRHRPPRPPAIDLDLSNLWSKSLWYIRSVPVAGASLPRLEGIVFLEGAASCSSVRWRLLLLWR